MKDPREESWQRLQHIERAIKSIELYVAGENNSTFNNTPMLHDAVLLQFVIIGEAIVHVEVELLDKYDYPWYKVSSFRNMIAHEYFNIKLSAVWKIIETDLAELKKTITTILKMEF